MLLIDDNQVSVDAFIGKVKEITGKSIPKDQIKNNMEFKYNSAKNTYDLAEFVKRGIRVPKERKGDDILASFNIYHEEAGRTVTFRFSTKKPYTNPKNPNALVYEPKALDFSGGVSTYEARDLERVIYMYCHPSCYDSPFHKGGPYKYSHINLKAESTQKKARMEAVNKAFQHAASVPESEIRVLAKGLKIQLIPNADEEDIRVALQDYAMNNSKAYLEMVAKGTVKYDGMIQDAIDTGYIKKKPVGNMIVWYFDKGRRAGEQITTVIDKTKDVVQELKNYMKDKIEQYYNDMAVLNDDVTSDMKAEKYLKSLEKGVPLEDVTPYKEPLLLGTVEDFNSAKAYLTESHPEKGQPAPASTKKFLELVQSGELNENNISDEISKYIRQS